MPKRWPMWFVCGLMVAGGGLFLWSRGNQNIFGYAMLLLCPLAHLLLHSGHDHSKDQGESGKPACH